jgi:hypothetical protein
VVLLGEKLIGARVALKNPLIAQSVSISAEAGPGISVE